jgi:hypothetical protein
VQSLSINRNKLSKRSQVMKQSLVKNIAVLGASAVFACGVMSAQAAGKITAKLGDVDDEIIIPTHNWSSQIVMCRSVV